MRAVQRRAVTAELGSEHRAQRDVECFEHRDATPELRAGRRHLGADEAGPDHDDAPLRRGRHRGPERQRVVEGPQREEPISLTERFGPGQRPGRRAGGEHDGVGLQDGAVVELDRAPFDVEPDGLVAEDLVHQQLAGAPAVGEHRLLGRPRAGQHLLRKRRAVVGQVRLGAHQGQRALEPLGAQGLDGTPPGERGANDDRRAVRRERVRCRHPPNMAIHSCGVRGRKT